MSNHSELLSTLSKQEHYLNKIYASLASDLSKVLKKYKLTDSSKLWYKNQQVKKEVDVILGRYRKKILDHITKNVKNAWELSNQHNDNLVNSYINGLTIPNPSKYFQRNTEALQAFINRATNKLTLSDRVWNLTNQTKSQIDYFIAEGLTDGRPASKIAKDLQRYLKNPEKRFRRLRNPKTGKLILSDPASKYKPGRGVYRSSYKNALRLSRNEINIAYRTADHERRKQLPFVTGITVHLSNAHPRYDICDELAGDYPKDFVFVGWHPNCLCYSTTKLLSKQDFRKQLLGEKIYNKKYTQSIPVRAAVYLKENSERIQGLSNTPYFINDNFKIKNNRYTIKKSIGVDPILPKRIKEESLIESLKQSSINVEYSPNAYKAFKDNVPNVDLKSMFSDLEGTLTDFGIEKIRKEVYLKNNGFDFKLKGKDFEMVRNVTYNKGNNSVYHAYLRVPRSTQGKGLTKKLFQTLYKQYEKAGINNINVTANIDVGGYAWAKYGFSATNKSDVIDIISSSRNEIFKRIAKRKVNYFYDKYGDEAKFPMHRLANIEGGKEALLNTFWSGEIDLKDKKQLKMFLEYLFR